MAIFKRRRKINEDFTYDKLPHNRFEVFKTLFKIRFGFILKVLMLTILFLLPLLVFNTYGRVYINASFSSVSQQKNQIYPQIFGFLLIRTLINIPLFFLSSIGMGGAIRVYRKLTWSEITFLSDYFDNLKINLLRYLFYFYSRFFKLRVDSFCYLFHCRFKFKADYDWDYARNKLSSIWLCPYILLLYLFAKRYL